jgi:DNA invertase Pin-like site-specific DNA recombinase
LVATEALTPNLQGRLFVGYCRVSTKPQGDVSRFGILAQQAVVEKFVAGNGGTLIAAFTEIESGRKTERDRPELMRALARCRRKRAVLVIARLDRLARNVALIARLMEARVEFVAADLPMANRLTVHFLAAVAEYEADLLSARRAAVTETMYRLGKPLGTRGRTPEQIREMNRLANIARAAQHERFVQATMPVIHDLRRQGITGYKAIAKALTAQGIPTASGRGRWYIDTVKKLIKTHEPDYRPPRAPLRRELLLKMIVARREAVQRLANERAVRWAQVLEEIALQGVEADRDIAHAFAARGIPRPYGGNWTAEGVRRLKERLDDLAERTRA